MAETVKLPSSTRFSREARRGSARIAAVETFSECCAAHESAQKRTWRTARAGLVWHSHAAGRPAPAPKARLDVSAHVASGGAGRSSKVPGLAYRQRGSWQMASTQPLEPQGAG